MSATTQAAPATAAPKGRGGVMQSVRDSLVVARRNLIRMTRIPDRVRPYRLGSISASRLSGRKELAL
ncbi:hypothetical protein [Streptomyces sp. NPDC048172]|uniref:hypothetical protein n=1 Tax=Streptomyces sp. NPDC048172 TaxID=3365505 RepID=UPI003721F67E